MPIRILVYSPTIQTIQERLTKHQIHLKVPQYMKLAITEHIIITGLHQIMNQGTHQSENRVYSRACALTLTLDGTGYRSLINFTLPTF